MSEWESAGKECAGDKERGTEREGQGEGDKAGETDIF